MDRIVLAKPIGLLLVIASMKAGLAAKDSEPFYDTEKRLKGFLLSGYDETIPPQVVPDEHIKVSLGMSILDIESLDEDRGVLTTHVWIRMIWNDKRLQWNASDYGGLKKVAIPNHKIWRPDIVPYNIAGDEFEFSADYHAVVNSDGTVYFIPHTRLQTKCPVNLEAFPFDQQNCSIKLGSWVHSGNIVTLEDIGLETTYFQPNGIWDIVNTTNVINGKKYDCCPEVYYDYTVNLILRRHSHILVHMYVGPGVCLGLMIPVIFMLPAFSTYKLILGGTLLIAQVLMMNQMADSLPTSHVTAPTISLYMLVNIVLLSLSLACSAVIIYCWERSKRGSLGVPGCIDKIFLGVLGRLMCVKREDYMEYPINSVPDNDVMTDDSAAMVKEYTQAVAPAEWRQLSVVCDRLLFVIFFIVTLITMISMVKYTY